MRSKTKNLIKIEGRRLIKEEQASYSNNYYYEVDFTCDQETGKSDKLFSRMQNAISKWRPYRCSGGCGTDWIVKDIRMTGRTRGVLTVMLYAGIGD